MTQRSYPAPTQFVDATGVRFAYRRFGKSGGVPIVFNQHYIGTMDYWDPAVTDGLARDREVSSTTLASPQVRGSRSLAPPMTRRSTCGSRFISVRPRAHAAGLEFLKRKHLRQVDRDPEVSEAVGQRQIEAILKWGVQRDGSYDYLKTIKQPTSS